MQKDKWPSTVCIHIYESIIYEVSDKQVTIQRTTEVRHRVKDRGEQIDLITKGK